MHAAHVVSTTGLACFCPLKQSVSGSVARFPFLYQLRVFVLEGQHCHSVQESDIGRSLAKKQSGAGQHHLGLDKGSHHGVCPCVRAYVRVCMRVSCSASHMLCIANVIGSSSAPTHCLHVYRRWLQVQCVLVATTSLRVVYVVLANCLN